MNDIVIEQALYGSQGGGGYRFLARSPGFLEEWLVEASRLCTCFGDRPANVACPAALFAQPFGKKHVAVVQVADVGTDDTGRPGALAFRLLVLSLLDFERLHNDPFFIADKLPPDWTVRDQAPTLTWTDGPPPKRTVARIQAILQRTPGAVLIAETEVRQGGTQVMLGGAQALLDGSRLLMIREAPDPELVRDLWMLLPTASRGELWPATFAFDTKLAFDAVVLPSARSPFGSKEGLKGAIAQRYLTEEQAADYPEGRYELSLQTAAEAGDQGGLDSLFARRTRRTVFRIALVVVVIALIIVAAIQLLPVPKMNPNEAPPPSQKTTHPGAALNLPSADKYPKPSADESRRLSEALADWAKNLGLPPEESAEATLQAIDVRLGQADPPRTVKSLAEMGPLARQVQVLAWKHSLPEYADPSLSAPELIERLQRHLATKKGNP